MSKKFYTLLLAVGVLCYAAESTHRFGFGWWPTSDNEVICDGLLLIATILVVNRRD